MWSTAPLLDAVRESQGETDTASWGRCCPGLRDSEEQAISRDAACIVVV